MNNNNEPVHLDVASCGEPHARETSNVAEVTCEHCIVLIVKSEDEDCCAECGDLLPDIEMRGEVAEVVRNGVHMHVHAECMLPGEEVA